MFRILIAVYFLSLYTSLCAEDDGGQYRLYGKAFDHSGTVLRNAQILFIVGKDTTIAYTDSLGNFDTKITWRTFDLTHMERGIDVKLENAKMNPPVMAIWNNKTLSIPNRWEEAQNASYKGGWVDRPDNLRFE